MSEFQKNLEKYAELAIRVGNNLQPGQRLLILGRWLNRGVPPELAPFVRELARAAYRAGARYVDVIWADQELERIRFEMAPDDSYDEYPQWFVSALHEYLERGDPTLVINAEDPQLVADQDPEKVDQAMQTAYRHFGPALEYVTSNAINWNVICAPVQGWADLVFPEVPAEERIERLWEQIFETLQLDEDDPIAVWEKRLAALHGVCNYLNQKAYRSLTYTGPGTELSVGLPEGHIWHGGKTKSKAGIEFAANLPTEEVFTLPHLSRVEGKVRATKPLSHAGNLIEDFELEFEAGKVVRFNASRGEHVLQNIINTDEGAQHLGEVALVPNSSSISQSGLLYYNALYDENAASHLALGRAYKFTMADGASLSDEAFSEQGGNSSRVHVDFMIGSAALDIDGVTSTGATEAVMRAGEWAFDLE
ncbi:MAG: aminopeptidase [Anaerolineales bacterium]|nr:aminopeptidase [Anaerolineales bacterium]